MKRLLGAVLFIAIAVLWYSPIMTKDWSVREFEIQGGPVLVVPGLSGDAVLDLKTLPLERVVVGYARERGVYFVYPETLLITITAPWILEKSRYPLLKQIDASLEAMHWLEGRPVGSALTQQQHTPEMLVIEKVDSSLEFYDEFFVLEQVISVVNHSDKHLYDFPLPFGQQWQVFTLLGEGVDYIVDEDAVRSYIPSHLSPGPGERSTYVLVMRSPILTVMNRILAECTLVLAHDGLNSLTIRDNGRVVTHEIVRFAFSMSLFLER